MATRSFLPTPWALSASMVCAASARSAPYVSGLPPGVLMHVALSAPAVSRCRTVAAEPLIPKVLVTLVCCRTDLASCGYAQSAFVRAQCIREQCRASVDRADGGRRCSGELSELH